MGAGALKQSRADRALVGLDKHKQVPNHPDYDDEVTDEQLDKLRRQVAPIVDAEEWETVDGPAW